MLLLMRVFQGMAGGPLMALSQTLLLRIFPKEKSMQATGLWAMTTLLAPVIGPVLGGWICDHYSWSWVFIINVPMAIAFSVVAWSVLKIFEDSWLITLLISLGLFYWLSGLVHCKSCWMKGKILTGLPQKKYGFWRLLPVSAF
jgi:DHA2 family multidrug resistance protein